MNNRRHFLKATAATLAGLSLSQSALADLLKKSGKIGIQLFSIPGMVAADFKGTMKKLAEIGYKEIEFFGPFQFSAPETIEGWKPFATQLGIKDNAPSPSPTSSSPGQVCPAPPAWSSSLGHTP